MSSSPLLDWRLFTYDDKLLLPLARMRPAPDQTVRFYANSRPETVAFKVDAGRYRNVLYCTVLHCTVRSALYCTARSRPALRSEHSKYLVLYCSMTVYVCVCVCVCARACAYVCAGALDGAGPAPQGRQARHVMLPLFHPVVPFAMFVGSSLMGPQSTLVIQYRL